MLIFNTKPYNSTKGRRKLSQAYYTMESTVTFVWYFSVISQLTDHWSGNRNSTCSFPILFGEDFSVKVVGNIWIYCLMLLWCLIKTTWEIHISWLLVIKLRKSENGWQKNTKRGWQNLPSSNKPMTRTQFPGMCRWTARKFSFHHGLFQGYFC